MTTRESHINELLFWAINDVFAKIQEEENITSCDIDPFDLIELDDLLEKMTYLVERVTKHQKRYSEKKGQ